MPSQELWDLEDKYDVYIDHIYGTGRIIPRARISTFLILNWRRNSDDETSMEQVELNTRRDLLGALMKSPGPFYQHPDGSFQQDTADFDEDAYLHELKDITIFEASGQINFAKLIELCHTKIFI